MWLKRYKIRLKNKNMNNGNDRKQYCLFLVFTNGII